MVKDLRKAALGYKKWKTAQTHHRKPWRFPEEIITPRISVLDVSSPHCSNKLELSLRFIFSFIHTANGYSSSFLHHLSLSHSFCFYSLDFLQCQIPESFINSRKNSAIESLPSSQSTSASKPEERRKKRGGSLRKFHRMLPKLPTDK